VRVLSVGSVYPPHLLGGYEVIWQGVTHQLIAEGHASRVLVTDYANPDVEAGAPEDPGVHRELRWYWRDHTWPRFSLRERINLEHHNAAVFDRQLAQFTPDVVAFWPMGGMSLSLITRAQRAGLGTIFFLLDPWPSYGPTHDLWLGTWSGAGRRRLRGLAERFTALPTRVDLGQGHWVFCSEWMRANSGLSLDPDQAVVLTPGVEERYLTAPAARPRDWSWRLLYLGRVVEQKGVITAIEALAELPPEATLAVVGSGDADYRSALERRASALGVAARVSFVPPVDRDATVAAYQAADVVLHPVRWGEPWGLVPLEAMAAGRPVVATGQGGSADFLADGANALLHAPGDAAGLAAAVLRLAGDPALRGRLVAAGHRTAQTHTATAFNLAAVREIAAVAAGGAEDCQNTIV
jgi:glycosyltransferase involved in cell wall biosynthesis